MKSAWFETFGPAADVLQVGEQTDPVAGAGQVLVRLAASGVNPSDVKKRAGAFPELLDDGPVIPNSDGAGLIEAVGQGIDAGRVGERVWVYQAQYGRRFGTAAGLVALDAGRAVTLPDSVSFEVGACLGIPAMTAHRCVFADGNVNGQTVLVTGGAGRVGFYAVQFASQGGARVITTASNDADREACLQAGASAVVNHRDNGWSAQVLQVTGGHKVDRVIDVEFGANLDQTLELIRTGGMIATYSSTREPQPRLPFLKMMYLDLCLRLVIVYAMPEQAKRAAIGDITAGLHNDSLQHRIAQVLPLEDIARANELIEQGVVRGCVILNTRNGDENEK